jgi:spore germination cell wall hydrolase CwlJ-like protein
MTETLELAASCLAVALYGEAGSNFHNQASIYNVIMNRSNNRIEKVCDTIYKKHQFEYITLVQKGKKDFPNKKDFLEFKLIAIKFLTKQKGYNNNPVGDSTHFHDTRVKNPWGYPLKYAVNNLRFY